ncbi:unnamed protein product [Pleuronectes platessa]|uniref:Uncharacterized protein n=1 Tax=Pleuronectes platessa TaxID=8262 RepID=A0A9N7VNJ4_PLEPL|nr:unnamed protein product [Pleuronectes platessa]
MCSRRQTDETKTELLKRLSDSPASSSPDVQTNDPSSLSPVFSLDPGHCTSMITVHCSFLYSFPACCLTPPTSWRHGSQQGEGQLRGDFNLSEKILISPLMPAFTVQPLCLPHVSHASLSGTHHSSFPKQSAFGRLVGKCVVISTAVWSFEVVQYGPQKSGCKSLTHCEVTDMPYIALHRSTSLYIALLPSSCSQPVGDASERRTDAGLRIEEGLMDVEREDGSLVIE